MKKFIALLLLHFVFINAYSQKIIFQENFESKNLSEAWKTNSGRWYIASLEQKGIKALAGDNDFALASSGDGEIMIDIPLGDQDADGSMELSFTYWVHSKGSKGSVSILLLDGVMDSLTSIHFKPLPEKGNWERFNQPFKITKGTSVIRLKFGEKAAIATNTVYLKSMRITRKR